MKLLSEMEDFKLVKSPITVETEDIAIEQLRETPENVKKGLEELRALLKNDNTIYFKDDDDTLKAFLRPTKWYAKSAHGLMKRAAEFKEKYCDLLDALLPNDEKRAFTEERVINVLKGRDQKGRRVLIVNCGEMWDPLRISSDQIFRLFYLIHQAALLEEETQVRGVVIIMDFEGMGMKHVKALSPSFSFKILGFIQDAMPLRLKEIHMVKQPLVFKMVWTIFKPVIREKLRNRIFFHGSKMCSLHEYIAPTHLPKEYGGELPNIDYNGQQWWPNIEENYGHFETWSKFGLVKK